MNEITMRDRDAAAVTWGELKLELLAVVQVLAAMTIETPAQLPTLLATLGHQHEATVFGQLLTVHFGPPRASG